MIQWLSANWPNLLAGIFGLAGFITGVIALVQSHNANKNADESLAVTKSDEYADWYLTFSDDSTVTIWNIGTRKAFEVCLLLLDDEGTREFWEFGDCAPNQKLTQPWPMFEAKMQVRRKTHAYVLINEVTDGKAHWPVRLRVEWKDSLGKDRHWTQETELN